MTAELGRFGHHPDPVIDYEVEVESLIGMKADLDAGLSTPDFNTRLHNAMLFRVGGNQNAVRARQMLKELLP